MSDDKGPIICPRCGEVVLKYRNPYPTVDIIIRLEDQPEPDNLLLIERKNPPYGWALPGGFVDYGESVENTAIREAKEETGLEITLKGLLGVYSKPGRDPRFHTITTVFIATAKGKPEAGDDAVNVQIFTRDNLPKDIAFDHADIIHEYFTAKFSH
ncbi:MAG: NUDIX hydrolase [Acidobacteria bacterium]|nr:NUDIX hydrolase [Acidobacteriota bacterium]